MYSKEVTALILADHAKGASAEETRSHLQQILGVAPALNTIYTHRKSITTEQIVDELLRQQERDITKEENSDTRMFYRDKLLDKLMPLKQEIITKNLNLNKTELSLNGINPSCSEEDKIAILDAYRRIIDKCSSESELASIH